MSEDNVDYEAWAVAMCTLLDRIENVSDDPEVWELCQERFKLAGQHGLTVEMLGETTGTMQ